MKKKILSLVLASVMALSLVACGGASAETTEETTETTEATETTEETEAAEVAEDTEAAETAEATGEGLKIAIVSSPSGVDDGSFNEDN